MSKIDLNVLNEYWKMREKICIPLQTQKEVIMLSDALDAIGARWIGGTRYTNKMHWDLYKSNTYYTNKGTFGNMNEMSDSISMVVRFKELLANPETEEQRISNFCEFLQMKE